MALGFLKKIYFYFEDKWYSLLDKMDSKVRVYPLIDRIDEIMPSFVLFLLAFLFVLVLLGYVLNFSSDYEAIITVVEAGDTSVYLSGVHLFGVIEDTPFDETTDSDGEAKIRFSGGETNFFGMMGKIILPAKEEFLITLSAEKEGYKPISGKTMTLESLDYQLKLESAPEPFGPKTVVFSDEDGNPIVDSTSYLKYVCLNNQATPLIVNDIDDGEEDGTYYLNRENCNFQITSAGITGYTTSESFPKTLVSETTNLVFSKISRNTKGTAIINLYEAPKPATGNSKVISSPSKATVVFYKDGEEVERGIPGSNGTLTKQLDPGTYKASVSHPDYYFMQAVSFTLELDVPKQVDIYMEWINPADRRTVNLRVIDSSIKIGIEGAVVNLQNVFDSNIEGAFDLPNHRDEKLTDANGFVKLCASTSGNCTVRDGNILVATVSKEGYLYKALVPNLKPTSSTEYDDILLEKATASNSGTVEVGVKLARNLKPLVGARTSLYYEFCMTGEVACPAASLKTILLYPRNFTESPLGKATYSGMLPGIYKARATYLPRSAVSALSDKNILHQGGLIYFDLNISTELSELAVEVYDGVGGRKLSSSDVNVSVYLAGGETYSESDLTFVEKMPYSSAEQSFLSAVNYDSDNRHLIKVSGSNYVQTAIPIEQTTLATGKNIYRIKIYPVSGLDGNVNIFFDSLYSTTSNPWKGDSIDDPSVKIFHNDSNYYAKFDVVIGRDMAYSELVSMAKIKISSALGTPGFDTSKVRIIGIPSAFYTPTDYSPPPSSLFVCEGLETDCAARCDDNYFFPACTGTGGYIQAGMKWANSTALARGTYSFAIKFSVSKAASEGDIVELDYRAREKHAAVSSKAGLEKVLFVVGKPIQKGVFFDVKIKNARINLSRVTSGVPAGITFYQGQSPKTLIANQSNEVLVRICNNSDAAIGSTNLIVASSQSLDSSISHGFSGSGYLYINGDFLTRSFPIQSISPGECYSIPAMSVVSTKPNFYNWLLMDINSSNKEYAAAINTYTDGGKIDLKAEFLAGTLNQNFDGYVYSLTSTDANAVEVARVDINVYTNCKSAAPVRVQNPIQDNNYHLNDPSTGYFYAVINGIYAYKKDCINIAVYPEDSEYETLFRRLYAGTGGSQDASLACIDAIFAGVSRTNPEESEIDMNWNDTAKLIVKNNCRSQVQVRLKTALVAGTAEPTIDAGGSYLFTITGKNQSYDPNKNFSDLLGFFPIFIQGKFIFIQGKFKDSLPYATAERAVVHLRNLRDCFAISTDSFDLLSEPEQEFNINNSCRASMGTMKDSEIPKVSINSFGVNVGAAAASTQPPASQTFSCSITLTSSTGSESKPIASNATSSITFLTKNGVLQTFGPIVPFTTTFENPSASKVNCTPLSTDFEFWIDGGYLRARYNAPNPIKINNDGNLELLVSRGTDTGTHYGIINIKDYIK